MSILTAINSSMEAGHAESLSAERQGKVWNALVESVNAAFESGAATSATVVEWEAAEWENGMLEMVSDGLIPEEFAYKNTSKGRSLRRNVWVTPDGVFVAPPVGEKERKEYKDNGNKNILGAYGSAWAVLRQAIELGVEYKGLGKSAVNAAVVKAKAASSVPSASPSSKEVKEVWVDEIPEEVKEAAKSLIEAALSFAPNEELARSLTYKALGGSFHDR